MPYERLFQASCEAGRWNAATAASTNAALAALKPGLFCQEKLERDRERKEPWGQAGQAGARQGKEGKEGTFDGRKEVSSSFVMHTHTYTQQSNGLVLDYFTTV